MSNSNVSVILVSTRKRKTAVGDWMGWDVGVKNSRPNESRNNLERFLNGNSQFRLRRGAVGSIQKQKQTKKQV